MTCRQLTWPAGLCEGLLLAVFLLISPFSCPAQSATPAAVPAEPAAAAPPADIFPVVIANQKRMEAALDLYERVERVEVRKSGSDAAPAETKRLRIFPAGPVLNKIALSPTGDQTNPQSYRMDLEKLARYLTWLTQDGAGQREAYSRAARKRKERDELIASTRQAFLFTRLGTELRGDRTIVKYSMEPNPNFKPTTRTASIFSKVSGFVWIDEQSGELARIEGSVREDISIAMFLAKVYKGSHFMQERYEMAPGLWFPTYEQYDFDGRKYLLSFSIHERTFYSDYKKVGTPAEGLLLVRTELDNLRQK